MNEERPVWKKVLAILSIPMWLLFTVAMLQTTIQMLDKEPGGTAGYRFGYVIGQCVAAFVMGGELFFWGRWILRVLKRRGASPRDPAL